VSQKVIEYDYYKTILFGWKKEVNYQCHFESLKRLDIFFDSAFEKIQPCPGCDHCLTQENKANYVFISGRGTPWLRRLLCNDL